MRKLIPCVSPKSLLLIAGLVWIGAGASVFHIGILDFISTWHHHYSYVLTAFLVFCLFAGLIFYRLVQKHHKRISQMNADKVPFYLFFDVKSYVIMVFMIVGGKLIRSIHLLPPAVIGILYCGIGAALLTAGIMFLQKFVQFKQSATPN